MKIFLKIVLAIIAAYLIIKVGFYLAGLILGFICTAMCALIPFIFACLFIAGLVYIIKSLTK